jgi:hypothetical protein
MAMTVILGFCVDYDVLFATRDFERSVRLGKLSEYASATTAVPRVPFCTACARL